MDSSSSASLPQETQVVHYPYQINQLPGPKGAYEARQVSGGLYIRVDMPGVPPENLKLRKYSDTRTVTFSGKAPVIWGDIDTSERVYGGYVVLDRDPCQLDATCHLKKGCLRLFFPGVDGSLHPLNSNKVAGSTHATNLTDDDDGDTGKNAGHINPFLLSGKEGLTAQKSTHWHLYLRIDMPGTSSSQFYVNIDNDRKSLAIGAEGSNESRYDEGGRAYELGLTLCPCCRHMSVAAELKDGVFRIQITKLGPVRDLPMKE